MSITKEGKQKIISEFAINEKDTGSAEVQIAVISERIKNLTEHLKNHSHDNHSRRGLLALVNNRKKLLSYLLKIRQTRIGFRDIHPSISMLDDILAYEIDDEKLIKEISQGKSVKIDTNLFLKDSLNLGRGSIVFLTNKKNVLSFGDLNGSLFKPQKVLI